MPLQQICYRVIAQGCIRRLLLVIIVVIDGVSGIQLPPGWIDRGV
jgi:hypothetical protein